MENSPSQIQEITHISKYVIPSTKSSLKSFLGLITFYSRFIPALSHYTAVLNSHLTKNSPDKLHYDNDLMTTFNSIISSVSSHTFLIIRNANDTLSVSWMLPTVELVDLSVFKETLPGSHVRFTPSNYSQGKRIILLLT